MEDVEQQLKREQKIFEQYPVPKALLVMALPAIISQIIQVVYNMADTWYVGLTGNPDAVAAISLCLPVYNILTCISNLFGIGGASIIARALGAGQRQEVKRNFSIAVWGAFLCAIVYAILLGIFSHPLLLLIGGDSNNIGYALHYTYITITMGSLPSVLATVSAHLIRATGDSGKASFGLVLGTICNIVLDPLFMFVIMPRGYEVEGAAVATVLSNGISLLYFGIYLYRHRKTGLYSLSPAYLQQGGRCFLQIVSCGMPSFCMIALAQVSGCFLNAMVGDFASSAAVAGLGIVRKIDSLAYSVNQGITQGMLPVVSYCYASKRYPRMKAVILLSASITVVFSLLCSVISFCVPGQLVRLFIKDADTVRWGAGFLRILCTAIPIYSVTYVIIAVFQAIGNYRAPFLLCILRRGIFDVMLFFTIRHFFGTEYVFWGTTIMEAVALLVGIGLLLPQFKRMGIKR